MSITKSTNGFADYPGIPKRVRANPLNPITGYNQLVQRCRYTNITDMIIISKSSLEMAYLPVINEVEHATV